MLALQYLRNREHLVRRPSASRGLQDPWVQVIVLAGDADAHMAQESATGWTASSSNAIFMCASTAPWSD
jgi:hypothetical protein